MRKDIIGIGLPLLIGAGLEVGNYNSPVSAKLCFLVAALVAVWVIVWPTILDREQALREAVDFSCRVLKIQYAPDMQWLGIRWIAGCVDVRLNIRNTAKVPLQNIDLRIRLDTSLAGVGQITPLPMNQEILQTMTMNSVGVAVAGQPPQSVPVRGNPHVSAVTSDNAARLQLPSIPQQFTVEVVLATIAMSSLNDKQQRAPKWIEITGHYETTPVDGRRRYRVKFRQELT